MSNIDNLRLTSVTGDPINLASRVEGLTGGFHVDLLFTEEIRRALEERFVLRAMPPAQVKGKVEPIQTYCVEAEADDSAQRLPAQSRSG